jgi:hypothetical protein
LTPAASGGIAWSHDGEPVQAVAMSATEGNLSHLLRSIVVDATATVAVVKQVSGCIGQAKPGVQRLPSKRSWERVRTRAVVIHEARNSPGSPFLKPHFVVF